MSYPIRCDGYSPIVIAIRRWGKVAAALFACPDQGTVIAVFTNSFYCRFGDGLICIGGAGFPPGPLNIETDSVEVDAWRSSGITPGASARLCDNRLSIGNVVLSAHRAVMWQPPAISHYDIESLRRGAAVAVDIAAARAPIDSLAALWRPRLGADGQASSLTDVIRSQSATACRELEHWLVGLMARSNRALPKPKWTCLIGLGRGLTPSGDDLLGAAMVTFAAFGAETARRSLAQVLCREMEMRTSPISAAHLRLAATGQGGQALHNLIRALNCGQAVRIRKAIAALELVGHTSGWDMLAGVLLATRVLSETERGASSNSCA